MTEWACRTYGWKIEYTLYEIPAVQLAMLWRCHAQGICGVESGTLLEDEIAKALLNAGVLKNGGQRSKD